MSKDIRSYFVSKRPPKPIDEIEDDVIPESPEVKTKAKKQGKKKRIIHDSDDELHSPKKKQKPNNKESKSQSRASKNLAQTPELKEVNIIDLFGKNPIKRTEPLVKKTKKATETGIHGDDDFERSLLELDEKEIFKETACVTNNDKSIDIQIKESCDEDVVVINDDRQIKLTKVPETLETSKKHNIDSKNEHTKKDLEEKHTSTGKQEEKHTNNTHDEKYTNKDNCEEKKTIKDSSELKCNIKETTTTKSSSSRDDSNSKDRKRKINENDIKNIKDVNKNEKVRKEADFSVFVNDESFVEDDHVEDVDHGSKNKKRKIDKSLNESALTDEERFEKKRQSFAYYQQYLNRTGPKNLGAKEIPEGSKDCLKECAFLLTGVLDSFERNDVENAIKKYGGTIKSGVSKKVTHVLAGEDAGPAKMEKARELGIKIIDEDDFLKMIVDLSNKGNKRVVEVKTEPAKEKDHKKKLSSSKHGNKHEQTQETKHSTSDGKNKYKESNGKDKLADDDVQDKEKKKTPPIYKNKQQTVVKEEIKMEIEGSVSGKQIETGAGAPRGGGGAGEAGAASLMWVDKYKPQNLKQIIGQHGDNSNVNKLMKWLSKWYVNRQMKHTKPSPWAKNDDGAYFKAALLSGPPGVGKTTTVSLVCRELGFDVVELNASDARNKALLHQHVGGLLSTNSLSAYAKGTTGKQAVTKKHVLVMDEVDGMAGNEDRGGVQELIALIKSTLVPVVCTCNDRTSPKMRALLGHVYELKFQRPNHNQIKAAMLSICSKEGVRVPPETVGQLVAAAERDVRQTLNALSMWAAAPTGGERAHAKRDIKLGPWEAVRKVFTAAEHATMTIHDKADLFFYDYSLAPLFVQENYLAVEPHCPKGETLERVSRAADCISLGDLVEARIRRSQAWGLLPLQAMYSSVMPGHHIAGHVARQIQFPSWLGKNSRAGKLRRLAHELHAHTRLSTSGSKSSIYLDYAPHLRDAIVTPLVRDKAEGVPRALAVLESYHLLREDLESLCELALWPGQKDPAALVDSKVKAAMTRTYNKSATALPYAPGAVKKGRGRAVDDGDGAAGEGDEGEDVEEDATEDSDLEADALIKKKTPKESKQDINKDKPSTSKAVPKQSRGKKK